MSRKITYQLQDFFCSEMNFPKIAYHVFVCDSENYMEESFGNYFLGKSRFSYTKYRSIQIDYRQTMFLRAINFQLQIQNRAAS